MMKLFKILLLSLIIVLGLNCIIPTVHAEEITEEVTEEPTEEPTDTETEEVPSEEELIEQIKDLDKQLSDAIEEIKALQDENGEIDLKQAIIILVPVVLSALTIVGAIIKLSKSFKELFTQVKEETSIGDLKNQMAAILTENQELKNKMNKLISISSHIEEK